MNSRWLVMLAAISLAGTAAAQTPSNAVVTQTVSVHTLTGTVDAYGQLAPAPAALEWLSAAAGGRVAAVPVTAGAQVTRGQVLVKIAPTPQTLAAFKTAQGDYLAAKSKLEQAQVLFKNGLATRADLTAAEGQAASARAAYQALTAAGVSAQGQVLRAAAAGVVNQLAVSPGDWVSAGARVVAVAPLGDLWVRLGLTPEDAIEVRAGDAVQLSTVFGSARTLDGRVAKVDAQADPATGLIDAEVPVKATASGPFAGEWVNGVITIKRESLPAVPRSAVLQDAGGYYVFVVRKDTAYRVTVQPVIRAGELVGLAGIKPGVTVVITGNFELSDGAPVRIVAADSTR